jgi:autotransporter-associated beta strand protein
MSGTGGSLIKVGRGRLTLSNANTYTGGTTVNRGSLLIRNSTGSATGTGPVQVNTGTLGGSGFIAGNVVIGDGTGSRAYLSPGGRAQLGTLTILGTVGFSADATYDFAFNSSRAASDQLVANGVTINTGAVVALVDNGNTVLPSGTTFTVINNTAVSPIVGTFDNLPDSSMITIGNNTYQASYSGGDGNDLTLTVVQ